MSKKKSTRNDSKKKKTTREPLKPRTEQEYREVAATKPPADREAPLNSFRRCLLLTGLSGVLMYIYWAYLNFFAGNLATGSGEIADDTYGLNLIIFSMAIGGVYSFINRNNLKEITDPNGISLQQFRIKTERATTGAVGIALCFLFTLFYWVGYCRLCRITSLVDADGTVRDFSTLNLGFIILMAAAASLSIFTLIQARRVRSLR